MHHLFLKNLFLFSRKIASFIFIGDFNAEYFNLFHAYYWLLVFYYYIGLFNMFSVLFANIS